MKVELLHIADCPNIDRARQLLKEALRELGLPEEISDVEVCDSAEAEALAFPGSPTIRVDGKDVEATFHAHGGFGLACRTYVIDGTRYGVPSPEMIRNAMLSAVGLVLQGEVIVMKHSEKITPVAAAISALSTMACCLPSGIAAAAGAAGLGAAVEPLRPWLIGLSIALLMLGLVQLYRSNRSCRRRSPLSIAVFSISALVVAAILLFPQISADLLANVIP